MNWQVIVNSSQIFHKDTKRNIFKTHLVQKSAKKKVKLNKSPKINLIWADDEVQLLLESFRNFKTKKAGEGIRWENLKQKYKKIKDIFTENLPQQYNENEFPHSLELFLLTKLKRLDQNTNRRWILVEEVIERELLQFLQFMFSDLARVASYQIYFIRRWK